MRFLLPILFLLAMPSSQTELDEVIQRSSAYADAYVEQLGSLTGEERYLQEAAWEDISTKGRIIRSHRQRQMTSDFLTVPVGSTWIGMRHVREVDGMTLDPLHRGLWREAYDESTANGRQQLQQALTFESVRYNIGDFTRSSNLPTFPLEILDDANLPLVSFSKEGEEQLDAVDTWKVRFRMRRDSTFMMGSGIGPSRRVVLSGFFWIEPHSGRIFRAEVTFRDPERPSAEMNMSVRFRMDRGVEALVPAAMEEHYSDWLMQHEIACHADYSNFRRFESDVRLNPDTAAPKAGPAEPDLKREADEVYAMKVDVRLINVEAWVTARSGTAVTDLKASDFILHENRIPQEITNFSPVSTPYDVLLLFDRSGSTEHDWGLMRKATEGFISRLRPQDRAGIANFDTSLRVVTRWTDTRQQLASVVERLTEGKRPGGTAFYKAVQQSLAAELLPIAGRRRALVVLTDGRENSFFNTLMREGFMPEMQQEPAFREMLDLIKRERVPTYFVAISNSDNEVERLKRRFSPAAAASYLEAVEMRLESIAEASGGRVLFAKRLQDIIPLYTQIGRELGSAYSIGYISNVAPAEKGFREIKVSVRDNRLQVVQSRSGYVQQ
jgi:VWFA-related protein